MKQENFNSTTFSDLDIARHIARQCVASGVNLCPTYESWTKAAFALASLGEAGREIFHTIASVDHAYRHRDTEKKFDNVLRHSRSSHIGGLINLARGGGIDIYRKRNSFMHVRRQPSAPQRSSQPPMSSLPMSEIPRCRPDGCDLGTFLLGKFPRERVEHAFDRFFIGATADGDTVFPQVDTDWKCRTAKIIPYDPQLGKRDRSRGAGWLHTRVMKRMGRQSWDFKLEQCLFGLHQLAWYPTAPVAVVEAEKTALIATIVHPHAVWLATGGITSFTSERLSPLKGRRVTVYPDADAATAWAASLAKIDAENKWRLSDWHLSEPPGSHRDIADILLERQEMAK